MMANRSTAYLSDLVNELRNFPEKERALWRTSEQVPFEDLVAIEDACEDEMFRLLDFPQYFELLELRLPENRAGMLEAFERDRLIHRNVANRWDVTNLGLVLFGKNLDEVDSLRRKSVRIIQYSGTSRINALRERVEKKGYACGFESLMRSINDWLPSSEVIKQAIRRNMSMFPELAVREIVVNALVHQDFSITGAGPMVEIFENRIEITNPGAPLVDIQRLVDSPPRSRNESLTSLMRQIGICEERGSGWDKIVLESELCQLPAPLVEVVEDNTRVILFAPRPLSSMDRTERVRATYLHACLRYVNDEYVTNSSMRERFGISSHNSATASRLISEAIDEGVIAPDSPNAAPRLMRYVPWWAK